MKKIKKKKTTLDSTLGMVYHQPILESANRSSDILKGFHAMTAAKVVPKTWMDRLTINLKGGVWVGLFTLLMMVGCINTLFLNGKDVPEGVRWIYATVLGAFAGTRITGKLMNGKNGQPVEED